MTQRDLKNFFTERPHLSKAGIAKDVGISHTMLNYIIMGSRSLSSDLEDKIKKEIKKYGY